MPYSQYTGNQTLLVKASPISTKPRFSNKNCLNYIFYLFRKVAFTENIGQSGRRENVFKWVRSTTPSGFRLECAVYAFIAPERFSGPIEFDGTRNPGRPPRARVWEPSESDVVELCVCSLPTERFRGIASRAQERTHRTLRVSRARGFSHTRGPRGKRATDNTTVCAGHE